jgi:hypothetical protein
MKISATNVVSTFTNDFIASYYGGILRPDGTIVMLPAITSYEGRILYTNSARPLDFGTCASPYLNKH